MKGGTWTDDLYEEPDSLLPNVSFETFSDLVDTTLYAPLFLGNVKGQITPGVITELPHCYQRWHQQRSEDLDVPPAARAEVV